MKLSFVALASAVALSMTSLACGGAGGGDGVASTGAAEAEAEVVAKAPIPNFASVRPGLYRGGHPDGAGLDYLKRIGVQTIVDLEVGDFVEAWPWDIDDEVAGAKARGLALVRFPMSAFEPALGDDFDRQMDAIQTLLADRSRGTIYVHCKHGQDRTGLVIGLERVIGEGWAPADAHAEMVRLGFHTFFVGLEHYFEEKTGFEG